jgi:DNA-binding MarR family transcriptional regulator
VGAALFGGIFAYFLETDLRAAIPTGDVVLDPAAIAALGEPARSQYLAEFVKALHPVFHTAAALSSLAFLVTLAIREVPLRTTITPEDLGDGFQMPRDATSLEELKRILSRVTARENRWRVYQRAAERIGLKLQPDALWMLARVGESHGCATLKDLHERLRISATQCSALLDRLVVDGMILRSDTGLYEFTSEGRAGYDRLLKRREEDLADMLADWDRNEHPDVRAMMKELAKSFASTPPAKV